MPDAAAAPASALDLTLLLRAWRDGDAASGERLIALLYPELRAMASRQMRRERAGGTLATTALVHESYLRLVDQRRTDWRDRGHFLAIAAILGWRLPADEIAHPLDPAPEEVAAGKAGGLTSPG